MRAAELQRTHLGHILVSLRRAPVGQRAAHVRPRPALRAPESRRQLLRRQQQRRRAAAAARQEIWGGNRALALGSGDVLSASLRGRVGGVGAWQWGGIDSGAGAGGTPTALPGACCAAALHAPRAQPALNLGARQPRQPFPSHPTGHLAVHPPTHLPVHPPAHPPSQAPSRPAAGPPAGTRAPPCGRGRQSPGTRTRAGSRAPGRGTACACGGRHGRGQAGTGAARGVGTSGGLPGRRPGSFRDLGLRQDARSHPEAGHASAPARQQHDVVNQRRHASQHRAAQARRRSAAQQGPLPTRPPAA